ncbi:protein VACUOLELESS GAMETOPHYTES-like [Raphanus sativus]|uniref:Protein VACUOLELESS GAMETOPHYTES-like n=1 Tax=Raphanus sativus TaxID=3726 RepID=A0A9W3D8P2_RAPSA|nr:protein VACUOLELESS GAMETOPHYTES-like [Raphanus sativus]
MRCMSIHFHWNPHIPKPFIFVKLANVNFFGFKYVCSNGCEDVTLDVRCASIYEPYIHSFHSHPLFITDTGECLICGRYVSNLICDECGFTLCFGCPNQPYKARYRNDEHLLTFSYEKDTNGVYWCDLCERTINFSKGFYKCNECEVILHIGCLLGEDLYMNPGSSITLRGTEYIIAQNNAHITRPICTGCQKRCQYMIIFIASSGEIYCSVRDICIYHLKMSYNLYIIYKWMLTGKSDLEEKYKV